MGQQACASCGSCVKDEGKSVDFPPQSASPERYGQHASTSDAHIDHGFAPAAVADKGANPEPLQKIKNSREVTVVTDSAADDAGCSANNGHADYGAPSTSGTSYSTGYFGREDAELQQMPPAREGSTRTRKKYVFRTGAVYEGEFLGNERDGFGTQTWSDGAEYAGEWRNNMATGKGRFKHSDGDVYTGEWSKNIANGYGIYAHRDNTTYEGRFVNDLQDGVGVESWPDKSKFVGQFKQGKKSGDGVYEWPDGSKYSGQWQGNQIDGVGAYVGVDGRMFRGQWQTSTMHGCGKYEWPDGRSYQGQYFWDQKDGFGIFTWADGRRYEGYWAGGRQHGLGKLCHETGGTRLAEWVTGERVAWKDEVEPPSKSAAAEPISPQA